MKTLLLIASMLLATAAHAQTSVCSTTWTSKADLDCSIGSSQDVSRCLALKAGEADTEMDRVLQVLKNDLVRPAELVDTQRAWGGYRAAECKYQASGAACEAGKSGSACSIAASRCQVKLTCERLELLRSHMGNICTDCPPRKSASR